MLPSQLLAIKCVEQIPIGAYDSITSEHQREVRLFQAERLERCIDMFEMNVEGAKPIDFFW